MCKFGRRFLLVPGLVVLAGLSEGNADDAKRSTADDVVQSWKLKGVEDFQAFGAALEKSPGAAYAFRHKGLSYEDAWNQYADLCGIAQRYKAKNLLISQGTGPRGAYIVAEQPSADDEGGRGLSVFMLRTDRYTVTATIRPGPDGKSILGSIVAIVP